MEKNKYKVLIADDEYLIFNLIKNIIQWDDLKLEFAGYSLNGQDLLQQIIDIHPSIVITDISMPVMDGIELIRRTRELNIPCRFIIISGYKQFEYAHNALKYSVDDYILKPINESELNEALRKITADLQKIDEDTATISHPIIHSERPGKSFFLKRIIWEIQSPSVSLDYVSKEFGINFKEGFFRLICIKLDFTELNQEMFEHMKTLNDKLVAMFHEEFEPDCYQVLSSIERNSIFFAVNYSRNTSIGFPQKLQNFYNKVTNFLDLFAGLKLTIGVGNEYERVFELGLSYKDAVNAIHYRIITGCGTIIYRHKLLSVTNLSETEKNNYISKFSKAIETFNLFDFTTTLNQLFYNAQESFPLFDVIGIIDKICHLLVNIDFSFDDAEYSLEEICCHIHDSIENALTLTSLKNAVLKHVTYIFEFILHAIKNQSTKPIRSVLKYIEENYNKSIHLDDCAQLVSLNPAYLSNIFKKETGENFVDYLNNYRIEKSKELLKYSNITISEIAFSSGFPDARYYSKIFKKLIGITPKDYKKIYS